MNAEITTTSLRLRTSTRVLLGGLAIAGTAVLAATFAVSPQTHPLLPTAAMVGTATGVSWVLFGGILLLTGRRRASMESYADLCLVTMGSGMAVLITGAALNVTMVLPLWGAGAFIGAHIVSMVAADIIMGATFTRHSGRLGFTRNQAIALWILGLNGVFALLLTAWTWQTGGWSCD